MIPKIGQVINCTWQPLSHFSIIPMMMILCIIIVFLAIYAYICAAKQKKSLKMFPGMPHLPDPHWYLGHFKQTFGSGNFCIGQYDTYVKYAKSDGMVSHWIFNKPCVSVLKGKDVRKVLMACSHRVPHPFILNHNKHLFGEKAVVNLTGKEWKSARNVIHKAFTPTALEVAHEAIEETSRSLVISLKNSVKESGKQKLKWDILSLMKMATVDIFSRIALGVDLQCCKKLQLTPVAHAAEFLIMEHARRFMNPLDPSASLYWLPTHTNQLHSEKRMCLRSFLEGVINNRSKQTCGAMEEMNSGKMDLLFHLINVKHTKNLEALPKHIGRKRFNEDLLDSLMLLFGAGYETTSITLTYALYLLALHPEAEECCVQEIKLAMKVNNKISQTNLRYTWAVVMESLRLYPPLPLTNRDLEKPLKLNEHIIPAGTRVTLPIWSIHRDEQNFPRPLEFLPNRWVRKNSSGSWVERTESKTQNENISDCTSNIPAGNWSAFCAFAGGGRDCPGKKLAMGEAVTVLAYLVESFKIELPETNYQVKPVQAGLGQVPDDSLPMVIQIRS